MSTHLQTAKSHPLPNSDAELRALREWAHDKEYVQPGTNGTLPAMDAGGFGLASLAWGGPMRQGESDLPPLGPAMRDGGWKEGDVAGRGEVEREEIKGEGKVGAKGGMRERLRRLVRRKRKGEMGDRGKEEEKGV